MKFRHLLMALLAFFASVIPSRIAAQTDVPPPGQWTIVIHGRTLEYDLGGEECGYPQTYLDLIDIEGSMRSIGERIRLLADGAANIYQMSAGDLGLTRLGEGTDQWDGTRHHVLLFDWAHTAGIDDTFVCWSPQGGNDGFAYAAGESLYTLLRQNGVDSKVFALIGYSRGAVVASETTRRLLRDGHPPRQVIYLDGEGCATAGGTTNCTLYLDGRFDAWRSTAPAAIRFDNILSTFDEQYRAPPLGTCVDTMSLGGHTQSRCYNLDLNSRYAHSQFRSFWASCFEHSTPGITDYLRDEMYFADGLYITSDPPSTPTDPALPDPLLDPMPPVFNGDFEWGSIAGWMGNGGYGTGDVVLYGGSYAMRLGTGASQTSNYVYIPENATTLYLKAAVAGPAGSNQFIVRLTTFGSQSEVGRLNLADLGGELRSFSWLIPPSFRDRACLITLAHANGTTQPSLYVDDVSVSQTKLLSLDGASADRFGTAVSISGDAAVVGADGDDDRGTDSGSAYVFERAEGAWTQVAKLTASDAAAGDTFGDAASISGDIAIVGAWRDDDHGNASGSAYVFERTEGTWTQVAKLTASDGAALDAFGISVSVSGGSAIVGADWDDDRGGDSGSAYVFEKVGGVWTQVAKLTATDGTGGAWFGYSVSISGDAAVVGTFSGSAYVFEKVGGTWTQIEKLTASDGDALGDSVSISGDTAVVGASYDDDRGADSGSAYVFEKVGGVWTQVAKLTATDGTAYDRFGYSVSVSGDTAVMGAYRDAARGRDSGSAYVFQRVGGVWAQLVKFTAYDGETTDYLGDSVSISDDTAVLGARGDSDLGTDSGSAYVFDLAPSCPADLNGDGVVDFGDYLGFLNLYDALDPRVDFNQDGVIDFGDYLEFLNLYEAGC